MISLNGKYGTAKVFTDVVDQASISQVIELLNQPYSAGSKIRMMPDIHAGAGCTIGTTMTIRDKVCPNLVGVDIGCGMRVAKLEEKSIDFVELDKVIRKRIPSGTSIRSVPMYNANAIIDVLVNKLRCRDVVDIERARKSIGTLGGGNHFIEVDKDDEGNYYLVIHSGSRHLGVEVATYYQHLAWSTQSESRDNEINCMIEKLKAEDKCSEIEAAIKAIKQRSTVTSKQLAYLYGDAFKDYIADMKLVQDYAMMNREDILADILDETDLHVDFSASFETVHNYIDTDSMILRKGAVRALDGERLIIPMNMRDGCLICVGKGNREWNYSAPHGAGRLMSRSEARSAFSVEEFKEQMSGIYTTSVGAGTLDECPMAYKKMDDILSNIGDTVTVEKIIKPVYNFKAS